MARLVVSTFSCIKDATVQLRPVTMLIGPQASGKSVISKLIYFFYNMLLEEQFSAVADGKTLREFEASLRTLFKRWFPPVAWGRGKFQISFEAGVFGVVVTREPSKRAPSDLSFAFSEYFRAQYARLLENVKGRIPVTDIHRITRIRHVAENRLRKDLGENYIGRQLFVPAGRSFFTSAGKAAALFAEANVLDPVTIDFGRIFTSIRREWPYFVEDTKNARAGLSLAHELVGGEIKMIRDQEYVQTRDGRAIPFAILSSGQQEILPLYMAVSVFPYMSLRDSARQLVYIEEPEAHLFPSSQKRLIEYLASIVKRPGHMVNMLITTHSPYVLATLNNLMKAGALAEDFRGAQRRIDKIVPRASWLHPSMVAAYAIHKGHLKRIIGKEGLIDAIYLDEVSATISEDFLSLLEIENLYENA